MKTKKKFRRRTALLLCLGVLMLALGATTLLWTDLQVMLYNHALHAYVMGRTAGTDPNNPVRTAKEQEAMLKDAVRMFDLSMAVYKMESQASWFSRFAFPRADTHLAAMASFGKGQSLLWLGDEKQAVEAYKQYLQLNPAGARDQFGQDTFPDQHNLELIYRHSPPLQQQEGKGNGKGQGDQDGNDRQQQKGDPSNQAGHTNPTKL